MKIKRFAAALLLGCFGCVFATVIPLDNRAVLRMVAAGLSEDVIVGTILTRPGDYKLEADDLIQLKMNKVPDRVIEAMVKKVPFETETTREPHADSVPVSEVGVYFRDGHKWSDVKPEVVNWKTGGVVKHVSTIGVIKGDMNGLIYGPSSPTELKTGTDMLIYTLEGVGASEYQLVRFHEHSKSREFRTVTGGVFHISEGAMRDVVPYDSKKIAPRTYTFSLDHLTPGEYGLLPPDSPLQNRASASLGRIYTFRVVE